MHTGRNETGRARGGELEKNWSAVYAAYKKYSACDDGATGEGFSDSIGRLFADNFEALIELSDLAQNDVEFKEFVLKHIDETLSEETLQIIKEHAKTKCPKQQIDLCERIENSAADNR